MGNLALIRITGCAIARDQLLPMRIHRGPQSPSLDVVGNCQFHRLGRPLHLLEKDIWVVWAIDGLFLSEFGEHLVFKGTEQRSAHQIASSLESLGGSLDAYTAREHTCFQARILDEHLGEATDVLADLIFRPSLRENVVFAQHNLVTDASFNHFNVIFCRNVLIYFNNALQDRVQELFLQSMEMFGVLGLGRKESIKFTTVADNYEVLDTEEKLYRRMR